MASFSLFTYTTLDSSIIFLISFQAPLHCYPNLPLPFLPLCLPHHTTVSLLLKSKFLIVFLEGVGEEAGRRDLLFFFLKTLVYWLIFFYSKQVLPLMEENKTIKGKYLLHSSNSSQWSYSLYSLTVFFCSEENLESLPSFDFQTILFLSLMAHALTFYFSCVLIPNHQSLLSSRVLAVCLQQHYVPIFVTTSSPTTVSCP